jgi:hypothetical protein
MKITIEHRPVMNSIRGAGRLARRFVVRDQYYQKLAEFVKKSEAESFIASAK